METIYKGYTLSTTQNGMQTVIWKNNEPKGGTFGGDSLEKAKARIDSGKVNMLHQNK